MIHIIKTIWIEKTRYPADIKLGIAFTFDPLPIVRLKFG